MSLAQSAAYAGILQGFRTPREWGQGGGAYGKHFGSAPGGSAIHGALAFGPDSALHQDPRYFRSLSTGFWSRAGHAFRGTILTRTDSSGETLSTRSLGGDYGAAFHSNEWYPDRLNTARLGALQGSLHLGFDLFGNPGVEFWPCVRRKISRRNRSFCPILNEVLTMGLQAGQREREGHPVGPAFEFFDGGQDAVNSFFPDRALKHFDVLDFCGART